MGLRHPNIVIILIISLGYFYRKLLTWKYFLYRNGIYGEEIIKKCFRR